MADKHHNAEIIILTAHANMQICKYSDGVKTMRNGAFDYLTKGDDNDKLIPLVSHAMGKADSSGK